MTVCDDPSRQAFAASSLQADALDAVRGCLRHAEAMILRTEELQEALVAAVPPLLVERLLVALHTAWAGLDTRLEYLGSFGGDSSGRELWTQPTMQRLRAASFRLISKGIVYIARYGSAARGVLGQLSQLMGRLKRHGQTRRASRVEGES